MLSVNDTANYILFLFKRNFCPWSLRCFIRRLNGVEISTFELEILVSEILSTSKWNSSSSRICVWNFSSFSILANNIIMTNGKFDESAFWEIFEIVCTKLWGEKYRLRKIQMTSKLSHKPWNKPHLHSREWLRNNKTEKQIHMQWIFLISCTTEDLGWKESGLRTKRGKKGGVYLVENARWIFAKCGIYLHLLVFSDRKIQGFSIVLLSVNLSIRSIIRYFPVTVNPRKRLFSGIYRSVNTWRMSCLPVFTDVFPV